MNFCSSHKKTLTLNPASQNEVSIKMIETERLILLPLTYGQLVKYTKCDNSLEEELDLLKTSRTISHELKEALEKTILPNVADTSKDYYTQRFGRQFQKLLTKW